jgi:hypothetical protein
MVTIQELSEMTQRIKGLFAKGGNLVVIDESAPESLKKHKAITWTEDCFYHTLLGNIPEPGIWTVGRTKEESWQIFNEQFEQRINTDNTLKPASIVEVERFPMDFNYDEFVRKCKERGWST